MENGNGVGRRVRRTERKGRGEEGGAGRLRHTYRETETLRR